MEQTHTINLPNGEQITIGSETHTAETSSGVKCIIRGGNESDLKRIMEKMEKGTLTTPTGAGLLHMAAAGMTADHCEMFIKTMGCNINGTDDEGRTPLFQAIFERNWETTLILIENGADVTWSATNGETPLHVAANRGSKEIVELLVSKGADIHANSYQGTPLHYAAASGNREVLDFLLEHKADPNTANSSVDRSPIFQAIIGTYTSIECLELLVKAGADPNRASYLVTPLEYAATSCDEGFIIFLLQSGADPNMLDISKSKLKELNLLAKAKAGEAFKRKNYFDAAEWYEKALEVIPTDAKALSNRSLCFTLMNNGTKALKDAKACVALKPDWVTAHYREGAAWKVLKDFKKAANAFSKALALEPHNEVINAELSAVRAKAAELEKHSH